MTFEPTDSSFLFRVEFPHFHVGKENERSNSCYVPFALPSLPPLSCARDRSGVISVRKGEDKMGHLTVGEEAGAAGGVT